MKKIIQFLICCSMVVLLIQAVNAQIPNYVPSNGLLGWWGFNGNADDQSGANHNGTIVGVVNSTTDRFGNFASAFDFQGGEVIVPYSSDLAINPTGGYSISIWMFKTGSQPTMHIAGIRSSSPPDVLNWQLSETSGIGFGTTFCGTGEATTDNTGQWVHIVGTYENSVWKLFLNTALIGTTTCVPGIISTYFKIGNSGIYAPFYGKLDDVGIWNRPLNGNDISSLYYNPGFGCGLANFVQLNQVGDFIAIPNNPQTNIKGDVTVEALVKIDAIQYGEKQIFINCIDPDGWGYFIAITNGQPVFAIVISGLGDFRIYSPYVLSLNQWHHIAGVRQGSELKLYVDGVLVNSMTSSSGDLRFSSGISKIGQAQTPGVNNLVGAIDEVRVWNVGRTQQGIQTNMLSSLNGSESGLVGYWNMNRWGGGPNLTVENLAIATGNALNGLTVGASTTFSTMQDVFPPTVLTKNIDLYLDATGNASIVASQLDNGSFDNCGIASLSISKSTFNCSDVADVYASDNALLFDGVDDYVEISDNSTLDITSEITLEAFVRPTAAGGYIISKSNEFASEGNYNLVVTNSFIGFFYWDGAGVNKHFVAPVSIPINSDWSHVAFSFNFSTHAAQAYFNGVSISGGWSYTNPPVNNAPITTNTSLTIGAQKVFQAGNGYAIGDLLGPYQGKIDEVRIWNRIIGPAEMAEYWHRIRTGSEANLVAYYRFDETGGNALVDHSLNGNSGVLTNMSPPSCWVPSGAPLLGFGTPVTLTVTDVNGNSASGTASVTVIDAIPPIVLTKNITVALDASTGLATITTQDVDNGTYDLCGIQHLASVIPNTFSCNNIGHNTVVLTATDNNGVVSSNTATVTVLDLAPPIITCSTDLGWRNTDSAQCYYTVVGSEFDATATDNCNVVSLTNSITGTTTLAGHQFAKGQHTVIWTATDGSGNTSTCTHLITQIVDGTPPTPICTGSTIQLDATGNASIDANTVGMGSYDNCGIASMTVNPSTFTCANVGQNTVTLTVTDVNGNVATCQITAVVQDDQLPDALAKNVFVSLINGIASVSAAEIDNGSTDNCGISSLALSKQEFTCNDIGANLVILTVTDVNGKMAHATAYVIVQGEVPSCSITAIPTTNTYTGALPTTIFLGYGAQSTTLSATSTGGSSFTYSWSGNTALLSNTNTANPVFTPTSAGSYTYTVTTTNEFGCSNTCDVTIAVVDVRCGTSKSPKVIVCHNGQTICISPSAVNAHLKSHLGDYLGSCGGAKNVIATSGHFFDVLTYPNPFHDAFTIELISESDAEVNISVYDLNGKQIERIENASPFEIPALGAGLPQGIYLVAVTQDGITKVVKISKVY